MTGARLAFFAQSWYTVLQKEQAAGGTPPAEGINRMPILQYKCSRCQNKFEELVKKYDDPVSCPVCGAPADRDWSGEMFSATGKPSKKCSGNCKTCGGCR